MSKETDQEIVMVPVPKQALGAVYSVLAKALAGGQPSGPTNESEDPASVVEAGTRESKMKWWSEDRLARLKADLERFPSVDVIMRLASASPDKAISIREVERESKLAQRQIAAQLAAFTKYCKSEFGRAEWPFDARWTAGDTRASYVMGKEIATRWGALGN